MRLISACLLFPFPVIMPTLKHRSSEEKQPPFLDWYLLQFQQAHCTARALGSWGSRLPQCLSIPWLSHSANPPSLWPAGLQPLLLCSGDLWDHWAKVNSCSGSCSCPLQEPQHLCPGPGPCCCSEPWGWTGFSPGLSPQGHSADSVQPRPQIPLCCAGVS